MVTSRSGRRANADEFPPFVLREYAVIADGERGALIGPRGDICWLCVPSWNSDAVLSSLIGGAGTYAIVPEGEPFVWGGFYEDGSLIWHSRWVTTSHEVECREALAFPGDPHTAVILRRVLAVDGPATVRVVLDARAQFGHRSMREVVREAGVWTARAGSLYLRWSGAARAVLRSDGRLETVVTIDAEGHRDFVLELSDRPFTTGPVDADEAWSATAEAWGRAVPEITGTIADRDARHAYAVLQGLTSAGGGMVAGATMSLPERVERGRNYDYRYAWIRDQTYAGIAVATHGAYPLLDDAVRFVTERILDDGPQLKPAYTIVGGDVPDERTLKLDGYPGGSDKVGNWVNKQFQLDAFGDALQLFAAAAERDRLDSEHWRAVEAAVAAIEARGDEPDAGIWELENAQWTHSKLSCVAGLRAIAPHAPASYGGRLGALADRMLAAVSASSIHPTGRWQRSPDDQRIDSALLIPAVRGALPPEDSRTRATLAAALDELSDDGYMYRYRHDERPLAEAEGAFLLCGFMTSLALHQAGDEVEANRWFERTRTACGTPGLFSEEYDITQRQMRGNIPQAFVHALLLETAKRLADPPAG